MFTEFVRGKLLTKQRMQQLKSQHIMQMLHVRFLLTSQR